jgi:class 3 adenylate cyclase/tetratricopeptide (TPR) repeat protein/predicted Ser/Thr protein kinase
VALIGAAATLFVVVSWSPDNLVQTPPDVIRIKAATDAEKLGLQVSGEPVVRISAGPRQYSSSFDLKVLLTEAEAQNRDRLLAAVPPLRLSARFINATGGMGESGELLLEYNLDGELIAASFGIDNKVPVWLRGPVNSVLSDQLAESLVGPDPPHFDSMPRTLAYHLASAVLGGEPGAPEKVPVMNGEELLYHTAADQPGAYLFWAHDGSWMALRQPVPYAAVSYQKSIADSLLGKAVDYLTTAAWLIALLLAWHAYRRNNTVGHIWFCVVLLAVGFLPMLRHLHIGSQLIVQLAPYILAHLCVLLLWFLGESILREQNHDVIEHWDRLIQRAWLASTGRSMLLGVACGAWLALLLAGGGRLLTFANPRLIAELQGGYDRLLVSLPDYFALPSPLSQGLALTAATSALLAVFRRFWGNTGMMLAVVLSSLIWAQASPTSPEIWAHAAGLIAAVTAAWLLLRHGLLALLVAAVTAVSLPSAGIAWLNLPNLMPSALVASFPLVLLGLGLLISLRAPEERDEEGYLSELKTLLLSDLVESTSLVRTLGDSRAAEIFGRHDKIARDLMRDFDGREIDKTDGFLLLFDRPINAVKYALAYHRALAGLSAETEVRLESRVGIHFGEVFLRRNPSEAVARGAKPIEVEGLAKPVAARLMSLAQGRQTLLTRAVYDLARRSAVSEMDASQDLTWQEHGKYHAKGVDEPIDVYEVGVADFAPLSAPMSSDKAWRLGEQPVVAGKVTDGIDPLRTTAIPVMAQGMNIGHYRVLDRLGRGGMGEVYAAEDSRLNRRVAIKALPVELASDPESLQRFEREAQAVATLDHPNIVTVYSVEEHSGRSYLIMELIEGKSLGEMIHPRGMPLNDFFELAIPFADAIAAAHESGITHRDLKPTNVMIGINGRLKVLDFGLAKFAQPQEEEADQEQLTSTGRVLGTMPYMSPEQVRGKPVDHRTDIFSIGIIFFELLTGKRPFSGETQADLISTIVRDAPAELADIRSKIPRQLRRIIRLCLEKEPDGRYQSATELRQALEEARAELKPGMDKSTRSFPVRQVLAGTAITVVVCAGGFMLWKYRDLLTAPPPPTSGEVVTAVDQPIDEAAAAELLSSGRLAEALEAYQGLLAETPDSPQLRRGLARAHIASGAYTAAVALLNPTPESPPLELPDLILLAEAHHLLGDHESELDLARQALSAQPENQQAIHMQGVALAAAGQAEEATESFYALLALNSSGHHLVDIANELQVHGHQAAACQLYQQLDDWYHGLSWQELAAAPGAPQAATISRLMLGDLDGAGSYLDQIRTLSSAEQTGLGITPAMLTSLTAQLAALRGDRDEANRLRQELVSTDLQDKPGGNLAPQIPVAVALGDIELAVELLRGAVALGLAQDRSLHADPLLNQLEEPLVDLLANHETVPTANQGEAE